ncbi:MAG: hypothetical protein EOO43_24480 [Flavobacterium sp.]|nr:MAG: hypothetical protein EOO43_24480 [Flavobacterium sp.]
MKNEASSGAVALIKIYGYTLNPTVIKTNYQELSKTLIKSELTNTTPVTHFLKGKVYNARTNISVVGASVNVEKKDPTRQTISGSTGEYSMPLPSENSFALNVKSKGYLDYSESITNPSTSESMVKDVYLTPIEVGETVTLKNIIFHQSKYNLLPESLPELDMLVSLLKDNPTMEIELSGHTDNKGDFNKNIELSENRAKMAKDYIVSKGINASRINGKGYGSTKPIASNAKEETRKLNRRVEFTILKK